VGLLLVLLVLGEGEVGCGDRHEQPEGHEQGDGRAMRPAVGVGILRHGSWLQSSLRWVNRVHFHRLNPPGRLRNAFVALPYGARGPVRSASANQSRIDSENPGRTSPPSSL